MFINLNLRSLHLSFQQASLLRMCAIYRDIHAFIDVHIVFGGLCGCITPGAVSIGGLQTIRTQILLITDYHPFDDLKMQIHVIC